MGEFLAERTLVGAADGIAAADDGSLLDSCRRVATQLIGSAVGSDHRVRLALRYPVSSRDGAEVGGVPGPAGAAHVGGTVRCAIEATGAHRLTASVIGVDGAPLPVS